MVMKRADFEQAVFLEPGSEFRRALIVNAIYWASDWATWNKAGKNVVLYYIPNDIIFCCLYASYKKKPSAAKFLQLSFMLMTRNGSEAGYMIDPVHKDSGARIKAKMMAPEVANNRSLGDDNLLKQVYSEMWLPKASLKSWADGVSFGLEYMLRELDNHIAEISGDQGKSGYLTSLTKKFCGSGMSSTSGETQNKSAFNASEVGLNIVLKRGRSLTPPEKPNFRN